MYLYAVVCLYLSIPTVTVVSTTKCKVIFFTCDEASVNVEYMRIVVRYRSIKVFIFTFFVCFKGYE